MPDPAQSGTIREATGRLRELAALAERIGALARSMNFVVLDMLPDDARSTRSWEVEREDFLRRMEAGDA